MNIDRRITNGLAWAGVFLVVGIPAADLVSGQLMGDRAPAEPVQVAMISPVAPTPAPLSQRPAAPASKPAVDQTVAVTTPAKPVATPAAASPKPATTTGSANAVDTFLQSGRALPSYIQDSGTPAKTAATAPAAKPATAPTPPAAKPAQVATATPSTRPVITTEPAAAIDPIEVAALPPQKVAPVPMPLSMRPKPAAVALSNQPIVIPPGLTPASPVNAVRPPADVTAADLEDWETGPLSDFLAQHQGGNAYVAPSYEANGFYLDEAPSRPQRDRVIAREADPFFIFAE